MSTQALVTDPYSVPIFAPDGSIRSIPQGSVKDAMSAGGKLAVQIKAPDGSIRYVAHDQVPDAIKAGGTMNADQGAPKTPQPTEGFWHSLGSVFGLTPEQLEASGRQQAEHPISSAVDASIPGAGLVRSAATAGPANFKKAMNEARAGNEALGHGDFLSFLAHEIGGTGYTAATLASPLLGESPAKAGEQIGSGNVKGGMGTAIGVIAPFAASGAINSLPKSAPRSALSKIIKPADPVEFHAAEQSVIPKINAAAQDLGQPIKTAEDALAAIRQAKQNSLLDAHESAGPGNTIADLPPDQVDALQKDMAAFDTLKSHIEDAQKAASAKAPKAEPTPQGVAADIVGTLSPRAAHAMNLAGKVSDVYSLIKGKNALTPANLDASIESTFGAVESTAGKPINITSQPEKAPYRPAEGDLTVQGTGQESVEAPPEAPPAIYRKSGNQIKDAITVTPRSVVEPVGPERQLEAAPKDRPAITNQMPSAEAKPQESPASASAPNVRGSQLDPAGYLTLHGAEDGETAALMQLSHTGGQALRNIAKARGLKIPASADNVQIIQKIHDDLSPQEISAFNDAAKGKNAERAASLENTDPAIVADNKEIAQKLYSKADEMQANSESPYRIRAWRTAAENIETRPTSVKDIIGDVDALKQIKGVDSRMAQHIQEVMQEKPASAETQEPAPSAPQVERRTNFDYRSAVDAMSPEDQVKAIYQSDKTGLPNKRAFDWAENNRGNAKAIGMSDADGLKAMNDKYGHDAGDALLKAKAGALQKAGLEAYHISGDEFAYRGDSAADLAQKLEKAREILRNTVIEVKGPDGKLIHFSGADFTPGVGKDLASADAVMNKAKDARKASGEAGKRGEMGNIKVVK